MLKRAIVITTLLAGTATAQTPPAAPPQSPQAVFDSAQAAFDKGDWKAAITGYRTVLARMKPGSHAAPPIHARLATALARSGDDAGATAEITRALDGYTAQGVTHDEDLAGVYMLRGAIARADNANDQAITAYQAAIAATGGADARTSIYQSHVGLALAAMTVKPDIAAAALDAELNDAASLATLQKPEQAKLYSYRALAELNRGDAKSAAHFIEKALDLTGRTTTRVSIAQVGIRGNAALIYAKLNRQEDVRQYLAYSGAGHLPDSEWMRGAETPLPVCGPDIAPDDVAVVEFAIGSNGETLGAAPIYASRPGSIGTAFAASVKSWRWRPAAVAKLDPFWRSSVRMELRCVKRPEPIQLSDSFRDATEQWLAQSGAPVDLSDPAAVTPAGGTPVAHQVAAFLVEPRGKGTRANYAALDPQLATAQVPLPVQAYVAYTSVRSGNGPIRGSGGGERLAQLNAFVTRFAGVPGAVRETAWFRTEAALQQEANGAFDAARAPMQMVVDLPTQSLPADDPIRSLALLHLSLIDKRAGKAAVADTRLASAGINADQCSLLDVRPVARNTAISSSAFPGEALRWGFEGRVSEAFDIGADGSVTDVRTVIAYPPFVFGPGTEQAVRQFRYAPPTLGDQPLGCTGQTVNVRYLLPGSSR